MYSTVGLMVFNFLSGLVIFSVIRFSIYSVLWIRSMVPARFQWQSNLKGWFYRHLIRRAGSQTTISKLTLREYYEVQLNLILNSL